METISYHMAAVKQSRNVEIGDFRRFEDFNIDEAISFREACYGDFATQICFSVGLRLV